MQFAQVPDALRKLHAEGYRIAIVTNESIDRFVKEEVRRAAVVKKTTRLDGFMKAVNVPCLGIIAFAKDGFRKPEPSAWELITTSEGGAHHKAGSFFVGDACGRPNDHSDVDKAWAARVGIGFFDETTFFVGGKRMPVGPAPPTALAAPAAAAVEGLPSAGGSAPSPLLGADELADSSVSELRAMLRERGVSTDGCFEKSDLVERLLSSS
ncbi:polynucleotide kinase 3 phosphatase-domain-containing protein [Pavlovales sp. CCMP2436]|nr:polynucleotide kinase 3 phosphatase-domain-containing protein [Pavlovales sp. CCMP2436]